MIELENVTKTYPTEFGPKLVLDSVDATFPRRVSTGILGRNGAGKSTFLRILSGAEAPDVGVVRRMARLSWPIGYSGGIVGSLSAAENCRFVAGLYGADPDSVAEYARAFADIGDYFELPVKTYSSGMRSRVAFGLSMALEFDYYLVDEGIGAGDWTFQERCRIAFKRRADRAAVIIVSHQIGLVKQWCERFGVLHEGKLYFFDDFEEARRLYEGRDAR